MGVETISSASLNVELNSDIAHLNRKKVATSSTAVTTLSDYYGIDKYNGVPESGPLSFDDFRGTSMHTASFIPAVRINRNDTHDDTSLLITHGPDTPNSNRYMYAIGFGASNSNFQYPESGTTNLAPASFGSIDYDTGLFPGNESAKLLGLWVYRQNHADETVYNPGVYNFVVQWDGGNGNISGTSFTRVDLRIQSGTSSTYIGTFYRSQATTNQAIPNNSNSLHRMWVWEDEDNNGFATDGATTVTEPSGIHSYLLQAHNANNRIYIKFS
jgi:hypothetical protein